MNDTSSSAAPDARVIIVRERLRLLALGHYIYAGMGLLLLPFFLPFVGMMPILATIPDEQWNPPPPAHQTHDTGVEAAPAPASPPPPRLHNQPPPKGFFLVLFGFFAAIFLGLIAVSALTAYAGRCLQKRTKRNLIYVAAALNCLFVPYGTLLGVSTILVLGSAEGRAEFGA